MPVHRSHADMFREISHDVPTNPIISLQVDLIAWHWSPTHLSNRTVLISKYVIYTRKKEYSKMIIVILLAYLMPACFTG